MESLEGPIGFGLQVRCGCSAFTVFKVNQFLVHHPFDPFSLRIISYFPVSTLALPVYTCH